MKISMCGSIANRFPVFLLDNGSRMGVRSVIQLPAPPIGYVGVELCCRKIGMPEHFLNRAEVGASLE